MFLPCVKTNEHYLMNIQLINASSGNLASLKHAFAYLGVSCKEILTSGDIDEFNPIVLPGVGSFGTIAKRIGHLGIRDRLRRAHSNGQPILGVCLGMQMLGCESDEGNKSEGLGLIPGHVKRLPKTTLDYRVPNIGWHFVTATANCQEKYASVLDKRVFYHLHSYYLEPEKSHSILATIKFSDKAIPVAVASGATVGFQFHPEKSQEDGIELLAAWRDIFVSKGR